MSEAMEEEVLQEVKNYVYQHQNTVAQIIATRPIMELCMAADHQLRSGLANRLWDQDGLHLEGMWMAAWEAEWMVGEEEMVGTVTEVD